MAFGWGVLMCALFRAPARRGVTFFSGKKESHQRKLPGFGDDPERSHGLASLALGSLIWVLVCMPWAGWFQRSFANSFKPCLFVRPLRPLCRVDSSALSSSCSLAPSRERVAVRVTPLPRRTAHLDARSSSSSQGRRAGFAGLQAQQPLGGRERHEVRDRGALISPKQTFRQAQGERGNRGFDKLNPNGRHPPTSRVPPMRAAPSPPAQPPDPPQNTAAH